MKRLKLILFVVLYTTIVYCQSADFADSSYFRNIDFRNMDRGGIIKTFSSIEDSIQKRDSVLYRSWKDTIIITSHYTNNKLKFEKTYFSHSQKLKRLEIRRNDSIYTTEYFESGRVEFNSIWSANQTKRHNIHYYEGGRKKSESFQSIDSSSSHRWYENGQIEEEVKNGTTTRWCEDGKRVWYEKFNEGKFHSLNYWCNGKKKIDYTFINLPFYMVGKYTEWYENGNKLCEMYFKETDNIEEAGIRQGTWKFWDKNGNLIRKEIYENNELKQKIELLPENIKK